MRRLFAKRRHSPFSLSAPELKNPERELAHFHRRLAVAAVFVVLAFAGLFARFFYLQVVQHQHYQTLAESNRIAIVPDRAESRRHHRPQRRRAGAELLGVHARGHAVTGEESRRDHRRARQGGRDSGRATASASSACSTRAKNFESLPLRTRLTDEEVARFAVNRYRFPGVEIKARLFRQYPFGELASHVIGYIGRINDSDVAHDRGLEPDAQLQGLRLHRQGRHRALLRARAARHDRVRGGRGRRGRPRGAHALAHAADSRATTCDSRSTSSCSRRRRPRSATAAGRWSRSTRRPARCSPSSPSPGSTRICSSTASIPPTGTRSTTRPTSRSSTGRCAAPTRRARRSSRSSRSRRSTSGKRTATQTIFDPGYFPDRRAARTSSATTSRAATATSTCTKSIIVSCDTYYYMLAGDTDIDVTHDFLAQFGFGRRPASTSTASSPACCRRAQWKRERFAGKNYREEQPQVVSRRLDLRRHRPGLQRVHAGAAGGGDRDHRQRRHCVTGRTWCRASRTSRTGELKRDRRRRGHTRST